MSRPVGRLRGLVFVLVILSGATVAQGATLVWDPAPGNVTGYKLYYGTALGNYPYCVDVRGSTSRQLDNLPNLREGVLYYFSVTSYNDKGESAFSTPVSWTPPDKTPPSPPVGVSVH